VDAQPRATAEHNSTDRPLRVVVGVDGSTGSLTALSWAMHWALARGAEVAVLAVYPTIAAWTGSGLVDPGALDAVHDDTWARARAAVDTLRDSDPALRDVAVGLLIEPGSPVVQLLRHSAHADLLVVGARGRSAVVGALLGSVALHSVSAAECPVVVVPSTGRWSEPGASSQVVVGVDGSDRSVAALTAALTEAGPGGLVTVVRAAEAADLWGDQYPVVAAPSQEELSDAALHRMDTTLGELLVATTGELPNVQRRTVRGHPGTVLVEQAAEADLLVVASRGHGEFRGLVFGSVALHCVVHATCPVLVIRPAVRRLPARVALVDSAAVT
jgi:nucleotide-binding universal stress UspA family protein